METDRFERAVVSLAEGKLDRDVWRAVARANPPTFHVWANRFALLQTEEVLSACWHDPLFRERYKGKRDCLVRNVEKFHENFVNADFKAEWALKPFKSRKASEALLNKSSGSSYGFPLDKPQVFQLLDNHEDLQLKSLLDAGNDWHFKSTDVRAKPSVARAFIEQSHYKSYLANWLLKHSTEEIRSWEPRKVQDPVMGYIFGGPGITKKLNEHEEFRHLGYLSILNVGDDDWMNSFKTWWTRHGLFDSKLMANFRDLKLTRDMDELDDEFFTDRRMRILDNLLSEASNLRLRVPFVIAIKFKELFLCNEDDEFPHLQEAVVDGIKAFNSP